MILFFLAAMVRFKNRYFVVEIIWHDALEAPSTRPPQDITRSLLQKTLQVRSRPRCRRSCPHAQSTSKTQHARQESVLRNFGEVGAGNLLSGMTVKHFNPIASIFIARKKLRGGGAASFARVPMPCQCALALHAGHVRSLSQCTIATRWRAGVNSFAAARLEKFTAQSGGQVSVENGT